MNAVVEPARLRIRPMRFGDIEAVMVNELAAYKYPWTEGIMRDCLRVGYYCAVGEVGEQVVSHAVMSDAVGEAHVLNLCVHPSWQGNGFGRSLLKHLMEEARERNATNMFLEVRASNTAAQSLYLAMGFNEIAQRRDYYPAGKGRESALVFAKTLL